MTLLAETVLEGSTYSVGAHIKHEGPKLYVDDKVQMQC
jgi:hypothetical protein